MASRSLKEHEMAFKFHVRASILYWLALLFVVALAPTAVHGQESAREWRSGWLTPSTTVYNTQQQIEAALEQ